MVFVAEAHAGLDPPQLADLARGERGFGSEARTTEEFDRIIEVALDDGQP